MLRRLASACLLPSSATVSETVKEPSLSIVGLAIWAHAEQGVATSPPAGLFLSASTDSDSAAVFAAPSHAFLHLNSSWSVVRILRETR